MDEGRLATHRPLNRNNRAFEACCRAHGRWGDRDGRADRLMQQSPRDCLRRTCTRRLIGRDRGDVMPSFHQGNSVDRPTLRARTALSGADASLSPTAVAPVDRPLPRGFSQLVLLVGPR